MEPEACCNRFCDAMTNLLDCSAARVKRLFAEICPSLHEQDTLL